MRAVTALLPAKTPHYKIQCNEIGVFGKQAYMEDKKKVWLKRKILAWLKRHVVSGKWWSVIANVCLQSLRGRLGPECSNCSS